MPAIGTRTSSSPTVGSASFPPPAAATGAPAGRGAAVAVAVAVTTPAPAAPSSSKSSSSSRRSLRSLSAVPGRLCGRRCCRSAAVVRCSAVCRGRRGCSVPVARSGRCGVAPFWSRSPRSALRFWPGRRGLAGAAARRGRCDVRLGRLPAGSARTGPARLAGRPRGRLVAVGGPLVAVARWRLCVLGPAASPVGRRSSSRSGRRDGRGAGADLRRVGRLGAGRRGARRPVVSAAGGAVSPVAAVSAAAAGRQRASGAVRGARAAVGSSPAASKRRGRRRRCRGVAAGPAAARPLLLDHRAVRHRAARPGALRLDGGDEVGPSSSAVRDAQAARELLELGQEHGGQRAGAAAGRGACGAVTAHRGGRGALRPRAVCCVGHWWWVTFRVCPASYDLSAGGWCRDPWSGR